MGINTSEDDRRSALMLRDVMEHAVEDLPAVNDLVPTAIVQGRRRKARARAGIAATVVCLAGAVAFGSLTLQGSDGATTVRPAAPATSSSSPTPEPYRTPVRIVPSKDGTPPALPPAEQKRREEYQQRAAVLLDELLPDSVGLIRPVEGHVTRYQGETKDGKVFPVLLSVQPSDPDTRPIPCPAEPDPRVAECTAATLPGGIKATSFRTPSDYPNTTATVVSFTYKTSFVSLTVIPAEGGKASAPVSSQELLTAAGELRFLDLVRYAHENPVQERQISVVGG
ncbi:hypothetical protein ACFWP3_39385 [Streptomyces sp. NPDC058525]|uniref:hypothetical protein n=1 Tax=Streptomyces sp. NPDC058525 TaxID=3346538 RepID=UPI003669C5F5